MKKQGALLLLFVSTFFSPIFSYDFAYHSPDQKKCSVSYQEKKVVIDTEPDCYGMLEEYHCHGPYTIPALVQLDGPFWQGTVIFCSNDKDQISLKQENNSFFIEENKYKKEKNSFVFAISCSKLDINPCIHKIRKMLKNKKTAETIINKLLTRYFPLKDHTIALLIFDKSNTKN
ncbi:MAG: hypothetical protein V1855_02740 [bacterium]